MEKKYIIKLKENEIAYKTVNSNGCPMIGLLHPAPYTEPDLGQVRKKAYKIGYEKGYDAGHNVGYQQGLADAWDAARKIIHMPEGDLLNLFTECYSAVCTSLQVFLKYDASECIEKIRQYEQEKQEKDAEIKVGDEVINRDKKAVVTEITDRFVRIMYSDGGGYALFSEDMTKTGRHFPEIAAVLKKMRGEQDG